MICYTMPEMKYCKTEDKGKLSIFLEKLICDCFGNEIFESYFKDVSFELKAGKLLLNMQSATAAAYVQQCFLGEMAKVCEYLWPSSNIQPQIVILSNPHAKYNPTDGLNNKLVYRPYNATNQYLFDNFMEDQSNTVALQSLKNILYPSDNEIFMGGMILYIHGNPGVGKTHLLKATYNRSIQPESNCRSVIYFSADSFTSQYILAVKENRLFEFKKQIIDHEILLVDDLGFLLHRKSTVEELSNIISIMQDNGKNVIIATSIVPHDLPITNIRLRSRLLSGVIIDINAPSVDLKRKVITNMVTNRNLDIGINVLSFLSENIKGGIREVKGAIDRIVVNSSLIGGKLSIALVRQLLPDLLSENKEIDSNINSIGGNMDIDRIKQCVSEYYNVGVQDICNRYSNRSMKRIKSIAMYICRDKLGWTYADIAVAFNVASHSTVLTAIKAIENSVKVDIKLANDLKLIAKRLQF